MADWTPKVGERVRVKEAAQAEAWTPEYRQALIVAEWTGRVKKVLRVAPNILVDFGRVSLHFEADELELVPDSPAVDALRAEWQQAGKADSFEAWLCELVRELRGNNINTSEIPF